MSGYPDIDIQGDEVVFIIEFTDDSQERDKLKPKMDRIINMLDGALANQQKDVDGFNDVFLAKIQQAITAKIDSAKSTIGAIKALGIPMKRIDSIPKFAIPTKRRERPLKKTGSETKTKEIEYFLEEKEYQYILSVLKGMSLVIERNPKTFETLDEEAIRDHFLIQLNGHYEGGATGETFNASGKTDILIREENKNVFIAECKFWHGEKAFDEAIDQLLSYLSWHDTKCALLVFNKQKNTSLVQKIMDETIKKRKEFESAASIAGNVDPRYILKKQADNNSDIALTTQIYDIPKIGE